MVCTNRMHNSNSTLMGVCELCESYGETCFSLKYYHILTRNSYYKAAKHSQNTMKYIFLEIYKFKFKAPPIVCEEYIEKIFLIQHICTYLSFFL